MDTLVFSFLTLLNGVEQVEDKETADEAEIKADAVVDDECFDADDVLELLFMA